MKRLLTQLLLPVFAVTMLPAQDPAFRPAEAPKPAPAALAPAPVVAPVKDDTASAVAQMSSMDKLDATRPLKIGDTVVLRIVEDGEKTYNLRVQDSGNLLVPYISLVQAAGRTCRDVAMAMKTELEKEHFKSATVILALEAEAPPSKKKRDGTAADGMAVGPEEPDFIVIYGQVSRQGRYEVDPEEDLTVSQAILKAGGFSQFANDKKVKVIRKVPGKGNVNIIVNLRDVMMRGKLEYDIPIRGGDVIIVDEKLLNF